MRIVKSKKEEGRKRERNEAAARSVKNAENTDFVASSNFLFLINTIITEITEN